MNIISVENLAKSFTDKPLFTNLTFGLSQGEKAAIIGVNGCGKSTLLKTIAGWEAPDGGKVSTRKDFKVSYLPQQPEFDPQTSILDTLFEANSPIIRAIRDYEEAMYQAEHHGKDFPEGVLEKMDELQAWDFEAFVRQVIGQMGLLDVDILMGTLSGGQKKRVALAKILIEQPDVLLLDEPTNHLDLATVEWLEKHLVTQNTTLPLITHDRYFLDNVCNLIFELDGGQMNRYQGNYAYFLEKKSERQALESTVVDKARNLMKKELDWIRKQPRARGTKAKYRVEAFEGIKETASKKLGQEKVELHAEGRRLGGKIMELKDVSHAYDDLTILNKFNYTFKKNDRIGIVGKNGAGKTTFLNILTGKQKPDAGTTDKGANTMFGYYTQEDFTFNDSQKVIEAVKEVAEVHPGPDGTIITASQLLTRFLFPPEKQYQIIGKLSGGEKRRLQLLLILAKNPNFLILDEPTNDLDITTLNVLEDFLEGFPGCLMVVSHDRYFLDRTTDHLFVFEGGGLIHDFPGNYTDFREQQAEKAAKLEKPAPKEKPKEVAKPTEKKALSYKEKRELEGIEAELKELEEKKKGFILQLNSGNGSHEELTKWASKIEEIDTLLEEKELRWLELSELNA